MEGRRHTYNCSCGKSWTSRIGGVKKCNDCSNPQHPESDDEVSRYKCVCGNSWTSRVGGWKKCRRCGRTVDDENTKDKSGNENDDQRTRRGQSVTKKEERDFETEKKIFEEEKKKFEAEKKEFALEKGVFEAHKRRFEEQKKQFESRKLKEEQDRLIREKKFQEATRSFEERRKADDSNKETGRKASEEASRKGGKQGSKSAGTTNTNRRGEPEPRGASATTHADEDSAQDHEKMRKERALKDAQEKKDKGNEHFNKGRYEQAIAEYTAAIGLVPGMASFYSNRSIALIKLDRFQEALGDAKKAVDLDPTCTKAHMRFIQCLLTLGEGMLAERACNDLSGQTPDNPEIRKYLKEARHIQKLKNEIVEEMKQSSFNEALYNLDQLVLMCPDCIDLSVNKAEVLVRLRRYVDAEKILSGIKKDKNSGSLYIRGLSSYNQDRLTEAMEYYKRALSLHPDDTKIVKAYRSTKKLKDLRDSGDSYRISKEYQHALDKYTEALALDPKNHMTRGCLLYEKGKTYKLMKKYDEAIREFTRAIEHDATLAKSYIIRAKCYMKKGNYEAGMDDFDVAYGIDGLPATKRSFEEASKNFEEQERGKTQDYYAILNIERSATEADVKKAYMRLARIHHPDKHSSASTLKQRQEERRFKLIAKAYSTLSDSLQRSRYDVDDFSD